ncbi:inositol monophosphatase [Candidatus Woesearchaeota archaeon]|nr:inositol monophosphatase [Candidatus Woesearchaeota archaeon]
MEEFLDTAIKAAKEAGNVVMSYFEKEKSIRLKGRFDLVTKADVESEKKILEVLKSKYPNHSFIMEEAENIENDSEFKWIIDPIDGTTSFAHNYPFFSISIALYRNNEPFLGVVLAPYMKELFYAVIGNGAFLNKKKINVSKTDKLEDSLVTTGFPYDRDTSQQNNLKELSRAVKVVQGIRRSGSAALDLCYVAAGRIDGYWEFKLKTMDTAAGQVILREAGGRVSDFEGKEIKEDFSTIVATNNLIHDKLLKTLKEG